MQLGYLGESFNISDTIIIGGGFAGFGAAHTLKKLGISFKLITDEIAGGRNITSKDGKVNYGTYFIGDDYLHVRPFVKLTRQIKLKDINVVNQDMFSTFKAMAQNPIQFKKFIDWLRIFDAHYQKLKHDCETKPQKQCIEEDPLLKMLYFSTSDEFVDKHGLRPLYENLLAPIGYGLGFLQPAQTTAFEGMHWLKYFITGTAHEFVINRKKLSKGLDSNIVRDTVISIKKMANEKYKVTTSKNTFFAKYLIVALPPEVTSRLLNLPFKMHFNKAHMYHVKGHIKKPYDSKPYTLFHHSNKICNIAKQLDGTFLIYTISPVSDFSQWIDNPKIIHHHHWSSAFRGRGDLLETEQSPNLYLAGDFNIIGIEDSYISGIYAANQIAKSKKTSPF